MDLKKDCDTAAIKKAYKKAALTSHPDKGGSSELFQMVNEAYEILNDANKRAEYDRDIKKYGMKDG